MGCGESTDNGPEVKDATSSGRFTRGTGNVDVAKFETVDALHASTYLVQTSLEVDQVLWFMWFLDDEQERIAYEQSGVAFWVCGAGEQFSAGAYTADGKYYQKQLVLTPAWRLSRVPWSEFTASVPPAIIGEPGGPFDVQLISELGFLASASVNARVHGFQFYTGDDIVGEPPDVPCPTTL